MTTLFSGLNANTYEKRDKGIQRLHKKNVEALETLFLHGFVTDHERNKILKRLSAKLANQVCNLH